jgi:hypothetical protein
MTILLGGGWVVPADAFEGLGAVGGIVGDAQRQLAGGYFFISALEKMAILDDPSGCS